MNKQSLGRFGIARKCLLLIISIACCAGCSTTRPLSKPPPGSHQLASPDLSEMPIISDKDLCVRYFQVIAGFEYGNQYGTGDWGKKSFDGNGYVKAKKVPVSTPTFIGTGSMIVPAKIDSHRTAYTDITEIKIRWVGGKFRNIIWPNGSPYPILWSPTFTKETDLPFCEHYISTITAEIHLVDDGWCYVEVDTPLKFRATLSAFKSLCPNLKRIICTMVYTDATYPMFQRVEEIIGWNTLAEDSFQNQDEILHAVNLQYQSRQKMIANINDPAEIMQYLRSIASQ